jgi:LytS/YehU family sensor histidine kinase
LAGFVVTAVFLTAYWHFIHRAERDRDKYLLQAYEYQLSPHFVFNNINVLANAIEEDPKKASELLMNVSKLYRYTLTHIGHDSVPLQEELEFANNFFSVQKSRMGDSIHLNIAPNVPALEGSVPPVVLQLLIENAIKHNEHTLLNPLVINITGDDQYITVSNCKQLMTHVDSTSIGFKNIRGRYRLLTRKKVIIRETEKEYCVSVPLIHQKS